MKKLVLLIFVSLIIAQISAQTTKLAFLNADKILQEMPETKAAEAEITKLNKEYSDYIIQLRNEYSQKLNFLQQNKDSVSSFILEQKIDELKIIEQKISDFQQKAQSDLLKKSEELYAPAKKKLFEAIEVVRKEKGYSEVLNSSTGLILASDGKNNIEEDVRKKLNLR
jgi:outer membrane protein